MIKVTKAANQPSLNRPLPRRNSFQVARSQPVQKARKKGPYAQHDEIIEISDDEDIDDLQEAFDALTLPEARLKQYRRLPFLLRNLRRGFEKACNRRRIRTTPPEQPEGAVKVVYKYYLEGSDSDDAANLADSSDEGREKQMFVGSMGSWFCPMCSLHKLFARREMLVFHLVKDHPQVKVSWKERIVRQVCFHLMRFCALH